MLPFSLADWLVIAAYLLLLVAGGWIFTPRRTASAHDYFLAGGSVPAWLAALSVLSATQSAATFLGGPDYGYHGDLTYLGGNIAGLIAAVRPYVALIKQTNFRIAAALLEQCIRDAGE